LDLGLASVRNDPSARPIPEEELTIARSLIESHRWAALSTIDDTGAPLGAMVAYVASPDLARLYLHISQLSVHTRNLLVRPSAALTIGENDGGHGDPQLLARLNLQGSVMVMERESQDYQDAKQRYLKRLPHAEQLFGFGDFVMFGFVPDRAHYVGGFARAYRFPAGKLTTGRQS